MCQMTIKPNHETVLLMEIQEINNLETANHDIYIFAE